MVMDKSESFWIIIFDPVAYILCFLSCHILMFDVVAPTGAKKKRGALCVLFLWLNYTLRGHSSGLNNCYKKKWYLITL